VRSVLLVIVLAMSVVSCGGPTPEAELVVGDTQLDVGDRLEVRVEDAEPKAPVRVRRSPPRPGLG
jgi:hypothetical protein